MNWTEHKNKLTFEPDEEEFFDLFTADIGWDQGQIRPGNLGQHDLYNNLLQSGFSPDRSQYMAGLTELNTIDIEEEIFNAYIQSLSQREIELIAGFPGKN